MHFNLKKALFYLQSSKTIKTIKIKLKHIKQLFWLSGKTVKKGRENIFFSVFPK